MTGSSFALPAALLALCAATAARADATDPVRASLATSSPSVAPGGRVRVGLRLQHAPHWHTYWENPGDSGLATRLRWQLPPGYRADPVQWPAPRRLDVGGLYNFGYEGDVVLPLWLHVPPDATPGTRVTLNADAAWLMCREECIPGKAALSLALAIGTTDAPGDPVLAALFAQADAAMPRDLDASAGADLDGDVVRVRIAGAALPDADGLDAFVVERKLVDYRPPQVSAQDGQLLLRFGKSDYFTQTPAALHLLLARRRPDGGVDAWRVTAAFPAASP